MRLQSSQAYTALLVPDEIRRLRPGPPAGLRGRRPGHRSGRPVAVGPLIDGLRVIRTGLKPGDRVVIDGVQRARAGIKVKVSTGKIAPVAQAAEASVYVAPPSSSASDADQ